MRLSEIRDLLYDPTQEKAERLVRAMAAKRYHEATGQTLPPLAALPPRLMSEARTRVERLLWERGAHQTGISAWSHRIVILRGEEYRSLHDGQVISEEEYEVDGFTCDNCDHIYHAHNEATLGEGADGRWCVSCARDELYFCSCDEVYSEYPCESCEGYSESRRSNRGFVNYTADVVTQLRSFRHAPGELLPAEPLYLGVELEVVPRKHIEAAKRAAYEATKDFAVLKYDASVPDGFEIVSVPATLAWHRQAWPQALETMKPHVKSWSNPYCGMHVHFSRKALTPLQIGKILVFINAPGNQTFVWDVAGRSPTRYTEVRERVVKDGRLRFDWDHHDAIAVSHRNRGETLELRIFRGNVSVNGFLKNLDFVAALVEWSAKASLKRLTADDFLDWMAFPPNQKSYPFLDGWLTHKGYHAPRSRNVRDYQEQ